MSEGASSEGAPDKSDSANAVSPTLEVAVCQLTSVDDVQANVDQVMTLLRSIEEAAKRADAPSVIPDFISFPENALYFRLKEGEKIPSLSLDDPRLEPLRAWSRAFGATLHIGSIPREADGKLFNSTVLIEPSGAIRDVYRKVHLFDVDVAGHKPVRESDVFAHGAGPALIAVKGWKLGCTICYDLRFSELYLNYAKAGADVVLIPSAFLVPTGRAHWDVLTRARAIESQVYVLAAAQGGMHSRLSQSDASGNEKSATRSTYGHSIIVDPWGEVLETLPDDFGDRRILRATLRQDRLRAVRAQIPMASHRRLF